MQSNDVIETLTQNAWGNADQNSKNKNSIVTWHPEKEKMKLANSVLRGILLISLISILILLKDEELGNILLEICKIGLLPVVTLILGYYFSKDS